MGKNIGNLISIQTSKLIRDGEMTLGEASIIDRTLQEDQNFKDELSSRSTAEAIEIIRTKIAELLTSIREK
ncbi:hypothetical protein BKN14_02110 [Candidatus Gracilibacteria bacterium HOT-871]|nr:hypothetical protein BKN14_02110 [Candidatus Gracilibacteria bacterium HOT-871]MBB1565119.1 hypothetical protein [Candidatus Gracilibacteria bacterium]MBF0913462.1 hypothetical protein [Candidatus Gracilibacteria bacterium]RKW22762.1 MAG: hypothetical protein D8B46_04735 [Candidatus Gracilibacteria bacterium]